MGFDYQIIWFENKRRKEPLTKVNLAAMNWSLIFQMVVIYVEEKDFSASLDFNDLSISVS